MAQTANFNLEKPDITRDVDEEFYQLQETLDLLDSILTTLQTAVNAKAAATHTHAISDVINLASELAAKMPASTTFKLDDLTDVSGADGAPNNYVLVKSALGWLPSSALAALGTHGHLISEITGLVDALAGKSAVGHTHAIADTTGLQTALDAKAPIDLSGLTAKTTPVDADLIGMGDSAASFAFKKLTFANLKTWVQALFATVGRRRFASVTLSAAAHDITGIPAGVKCITLAYDINQSNAGSLSTVQLGTASGILTTTYDSTAEASPGGSSPATNSVTGGFNFLPSGLSGVIFGKMTIERVGTTNQWIATAQHRYSSAGQARTSGKVTLSGELTQIRLSVSGGTLSGSLDVTVEYG